MTRGQTVQEEDQWPVSRTLVVGDAHRPATSLLEDPDSPPSRDKAGDNLAEMPIARARIAYGEASPRGCPMAHRTTCARYRGAERLQTATAPGRPESSVKVIGGGNQTESEKGRAQKALDKLSNAICPLCQGAKSAWNEGVFQGF